MTLVNYKTSLLAALLSGAKEGIWPPRHQGYAHGRVVKLENLLFYFLLPGLVTNIPANMVVDQFGMIGLLTFIRAAETDPNLVSLALGADLTTLGLNLNSEVNLFPTFGGPWAETPCRPQDIDFHVPHEYLTNTAIRYEKILFYFIYLIHVSF